jgi:spore germination cell wall hydrolase CwlJ-like protein
MATDVTDRHAMIVRTAMEDRAALAGLDPFQPATLSASAAASAERECLAKAIYYEARSETLAGQVAVADVIVNRTRSQHYPDTICGVVFEGSHRSTGCQFTFTCDGSMRHKPRGLAWTQANMIAAQVMMGLARSTTHGSTHYHTTEVAPVWSASLIETTRIGAHIFYRFPTRKERAAMNAAQRQAAEEALVETGGAVEEEIAAAPPVEAVASEGA